MKRKEVQKISSLLREFVSAYKLEQGLAEYRIQKSWRELLGPAISKKTDRMYIRNRKLFVYIQSSVIRNELMMIKDTLIPRLNDEAGMDLIDDIVLR
jgi:hypothetical protein